MKPYLDVSDDLIDLYDVNVLAGFRDTKHLQILMFKYPANTTHLCKNCTKTLGRRCTSAIQMLCVLGTHFIYHVYNNSDLVGQKNGLKTILAVVSDETVKCPT